jgi:hypothetical protein
MNARVAVKPELLHWACERSGHDVDAYAARFPRLRAWATGVVQPTLKQLESFVVLRRMFDTGGLTEDRFWQEYRRELARLRAITTGGGGNFDLTQAARVSKRLARALIVSTLEGQTLHRDAFRMLGFAKYETFQKQGRSLGVA